MLGNLVCDMMVQEFDADIAILNSGTIRSDNLYPPGSPQLLPNTVAMLVFADLVGF